MAGSRRGGSQRSAHVLAEGALKGGGGGGGSGGGEGSHAPLRPQGVLLPCALHTHWQCGLNAWQVLKEARTSAIVTREAPGVQRGGRPMAASKLLIQVDRRCVERRQAERRFSLRCVCPVRNT